MAVVNTFLGTLRDALLIREKLEELSKTDSKISSALVDVTKSVDQLASRLSDEEHDRKMALMAESNKRDIAIAELNKNFALLVERVEKLLLQYENSTLRNAARNIPNKQLSDGGE